MTALDDPHTPENHPFGTKYVLNQCNDPKYVYETTVKFQPFEPGTNDFDLLVYRDVTTDMLASCTRSAGLFKPYEEPLRWEAGKAYRYDRYTTLTCSVVDINGHAIVYPTDNPSYPRLRKADQRKYYDEVCVCEMSYQETADRIVREYGEQAARVLDCPTVSQVESFERAVLHRAAEKIRADMTGDACRFTVAGEWAYRCYTADEAADLIDPEVS